MVKHIPVIGLLFDLLNGHPYHWGKLNLPSIFFGLTVFHPFFIARSVSYTYFRMRHYLLKPLKKNTGSYL